MSVSNAMFLFEVVVESVKTMVDSRHFIIKSDFADIFSLELKDPKQMHIVIPEPPPLPPEPPGKKGKKKPKPKKPKKGKKGKIEEPPPEPVIQSGQSVLFTSNAEFLIQNMKKYPLECSLWSKEDNSTFIGSAPVHWDPSFYTFLEKICKCEDPPAVTVKEEYNVFQEGTAKLMAKIGIQIKLSYLTDRVTTAFRTLSEDPSIRKVLYTGINSKTTSYMCTLKTTDEIFEENCNKIANNFVIDKPKQKIAYADYKNAPGANLTFFNEGDYCCMKNADKPPESIYKAPQTCPDVDFIIDYVRKIIVSCNDNMRMLTPRPTIRPRIKATDIDRLCYCKETKWPEGQFSERFKNETQSEPCPICIKDKKKVEDSRGTTFDIANIRGPCGRADCRIARDLRAYIETLVEEDNKEIDINDIIGPCGSIECRVAEKIQDFLRHRGVFSQGSTLEGLSTQCACVKQMQDALARNDSCNSSCEKDCSTSDSEASKCEGKACPFNNDKLVYNVYYFTVEHDFDNANSGTTSPSDTDKSSKYQYCSTDCPSMKASEKTTCSKSACSNLTEKNYKDINEKQSTCHETKCSSVTDYPPSPADSDIVIKFDDIHNPCCLKTCDVAGKVKDIIVDGLTSKKKTTQEDDSCYCDCDCTFKLTKNTTYCAVCGGYECIGDDMNEMPMYMKPHPCPVYHKLYDKKYIKTQSPWPEEDIQKPIDSVSNKSSRTAAGSRAGPRSERLTVTRSMKSLSDKGVNKKEKHGVEKVKNVKQEKKKVGKFTANVEQTRSPMQIIEKKLETKYPYPAVPKNMGWNWTAEDIPGMKPRPKWKPGAANKILVRRYRAIREGVDIIAKKKRAMMQRKKKIEMKPTLVVKKQNGEYTVQMEVFKKYSKERLLFQYPYDEKPPLIYTIGKTEEEKRKIQKQRERRERRETRRKSRLLQSTFRDRCQEICLKAYNQAIGVLPLPRPNDPACPCQTEAVRDLSPPIDSCSCSDGETISSSDTDNDEWIIEFTPPGARWDVKAKHPPVIADNESQYNYLDYKVKLLDKQGNPVPRFFKGPDGKQECSDLGGFWSPDHVWMEINKDGFIGPDERWVPMNFIGPDGMFYSAEEGFFTDNTGKTLKIGIDGYIDRDGKWAWYSKNRGRSPNLKSTITATTASPSKKSSPIYDHATNKSETKTKNEKKDATHAPKSVTEKDKEKKVLSHSSNKAKSPLVMNVSVNYNRNRSIPRSTYSYKQAEAKKLAKYKEIMGELEFFDDIELNLKAKTNRASNTPVKNPFTVYSQGKCIKQTETCSVRSCKEVIPIQC